MKGLILKDFYLIMVNKIMYVVFAGIAFALVLSSKDGSRAVMALAYITMLTSMAIITTISYDEMDHSNTHLMTLPITRREYAIGKTLCGIIMLILIWVSSMLLFTIILTLKNITINWTEWLLSGFAVFVALSLMLALLIPTQIKFSGEKGKAVAISVGFVIAFLILGSVTLLRKMGVDVDYYSKLFLDTILKAGYFVMVLGTLIIVLLAMFLSICVSTKILKKKEY